MNVDCVSFNKYDAFTDTNHFNCRFASTKFLSRINLSQFKFVGGSCQRFISKALHQRERETSQLTRDSTPGQASLAHRLAGNYVVHELTCGYSDIREQLFPIEYF